MSLPFPTNVSSSMPLSVCLLAPPAMPSLSDCFPCASVDLGKYVLYSSALSRQARWCSALIITVGTIDGGRCRRSRMGSTGRRTGFIYSIKYLRLQKNPLVRCRHLAATGRATRSTSGSGRMGERGGHGPNQNQMIITVVAGWISLPTCCCRN